MSASRYIAQPRAIQGIGALHHGTTRNPSRYAINVVQNGQGALLLLQRAPHARLGPGLWGFSGGHIEPAETPEQCSLRELKEELGAEHDVELLAAIGPVPDSFYGGVMEIHLFHYLWRSGRIVLNPEHTRFAWVEREHYQDYPVMDGIDEDIAYFGIWPRSYLNPEKLPR